MRKKNKTIRVYTRWFECKRYEIKRDTPKGSAKRLWAYAKLYLVYPWLLIWRWLKHDWRLFIVFGAWVVIVSCEVWFPYLMGFIEWGTERSKWWFSIGSACWIFWAGPGTPFLAICLALTIATEAIYRRIKRNGNERHSRDDEERRL